MAGRWISICAGDVPCPVRAGNPHVRCKEAVACAVPSAFNSKNSAADPPFAQGYGEACSGLYSATTGSHRAVIDATADPVVAVFVPSTDPCG